MPTWLALRFLGVQAALEVRGKAPGTTTLTVEVTAMDDEAGNPLAPATFRTQVQVR